MHKNYLEKRDLIRHGSMKNQIRESGLSDQNRFYPGRVYPLPSLSVVFNNKVESMTIKAGKRQKMFKLKRDKNKKKNTLNVDD